MIMKMINRLQDYPWGSKHFLQDLLGLEKTGPLAELWMGIHPRGMSQVELKGRAPLDLKDYIGNDPDAVLGSSVHQNFGNLPYLLKLLAAGEPLSIQAHPSKGQAEAGFAYENEQGIPLDGFNRNYKDDNHKPEIICALGDYWAMKGFRSPLQILSYFSSWCPESLQPLLFSESAEDESLFLKSFFISLMNLKEPQLSELLTAALSWCALQEDDACHWVLKLQDKYPGDRGILAPLYLNTLCLKEGEALYLPAGELHAYLEGFGVELMANSDNVLRGGLTQKYMDIGELEKILRFESADITRIVPERSADGTGVYKTDSREFELVALDCDGSSLSLEAGYPVSILIVVQGGLTLREAVESVSLSPGESCFLSYSDSPRIIEGSGKAFIARIPLP
ncbi:mannose-6-phosphate isomerase, class I [Oceanispirochaeta crateris]|uniref:mannose-6-phosphate isomerase n=1 Tax=Oceanispirochaeta crateris TaxID=2518645 RepID=A0A5C1QI68_9SPIO|nr:mannose-6-phosphate isomerase, class I [Oceanispirochaeta crateris]QEN07845.1 mannose-6-phosphate isomerase, class I [Oceanispirochaeta crateris]